MKIIRWINVAAASVWLFCFAEILASNLGIDWLTFDRAGCFDTKWACVVPMLVVISSLIWTGISALIWASSSVVVLFWHKRSPSEYDFWIGLLGLIAPVWVGLSIFGEASPIGGHYIIFFGLSVLTFLSVIRPISAPR